MLKSSINAEVRSNIGSGSSNRIRNSGHIPGVVYGHNTTPQNIEVDRKDFNNILRNYGTSVLVDLKVGNRTIISMIKEIQRDPVKNNILHIDFQAVSYNKPIHTTVPVTLVGRERVENNQATTQYQLRELNVECLPQNIPENIQINVKDLAFGHPLKIGDVEFSEEVIVLHDPEEIVASLTHAQQVADREVSEEIENPEDESLIL